MKIVIVKTKCDFIRLILINFQLLSLEMNLEIHKKLVYDSLYF